jgi:membrane protease YdiL (CAAX protease family)
VISSLPDPEPGFQGQSDLQTHSRWSLVDLVVFAVFSTLTVVLLPASIIRVWRVFNPSLRLSDVTATDQVLLQGAIDLVIVGFIAFLIKIVHRLPFAETIHWYKNYRFRKGTLIFTGVTLAVGVLVISARFPSGEPPPIEKLLSSNTAMYVFAIFGVAVAPLFEEIIFRGFLFKVISDVGGAAAAVVATAVLFGALHALQLWGSWLGVVLIFVVGFVLSIVRLLSDSLIPSFIIHTSYNGMLFGVFVLTTIFQKTSR